MDIRQLFIYFSKLFAYSIFRWMLMAWTPSASTNCSSPTSSITSEMRWIAMRNRWLKQETTCRLTLAAGTGLRLVQMKFRSTSVCAFWWELSKSLTSIPNWTTDPLLKTSIFGQVMPRDRFLLIHHFFHFTNNANMPPPGQDRLYKIRPLLDHLADRFQTVYKPEQNIAGDESLLLFKGRIVFR